MNSINQFLGKSFPSEEKSCILFPESTKAAVRARRNSLLSQLRPGFKQHSGWDDIGGPEVGDNFSRYGYSDPDDHDAKPRMSLRELHTLNPDVSLTRVSAASYASENSIRFSVPTKARRQQPESPRTGDAGHRPLTAPHRPHPPERALRR